MSEQQPEPRVVDSGPIELKAESYPSEPSDEESDE